MAIFFLKKRNPSTIAEGEGLVINKEWLKVNEKPVTPKEDVRPGDQTFLTFPEWYLVFSPEEQAAYFKNHTATTFPYMNHTSQIWHSYKVVNDQIKDNFEYNGGYHFMIWVIGSSASIEYSIKAWYETLVGRLTDTGTNETDEDKFYAKFTQDYTDFIKDRPWYEFDFKSRFFGLWNNTSFFGDHFLRKLERKYIYTSELFVKWGYGKLIGMGTKTVYEEALPTTVVLLDSLDHDSEVILKVLERRLDGSALVSLPRYDKFNMSACILAMEGYSFREIAGNNSAILLTIIVPTDKKITYENSQVVFTQPLATETGYKRVALTTRVTDLHKLLRQLQANAIPIEHIFDF